MAPPRVHPSPRSQQHVSIVCVPNHPSHAGRGPRWPPAGGLFYLMSQTEAIFCLGECLFTNTHVPCVFSFMAMVSVEFGGLTELARAVDNYRDNINILYGNSDQFSLAPERVLRNMVVVMYARYIDLFPVSGTCVGHRALLMYSMLEFAMLIGRYGRRERQINKHLDDPVNPSDPRLSVDVLVRSPEENERSAQMENVYEGAMQLLGEPDGVLYAEPLSMAQHYDLMVAGSRHIGYLPECSSRKTAEDVAALFLWERGELLARIRSYVDNRTIECNIIVPTCLRTPVLILDPQGVHAQVPPSNPAGRVPHRLPRQRLRFCEAAQ